MRTYRALPRASSSSEGLLDTSSPTLPGSQHTLERFPRALIRERTLEEKKKRDLKLTDSQFIVVLQIRDCCSRIRYESENGEREKEKNDGKKTHGTLVPIP